MVGSALLLKLNTKERLFYYSIGLFVFSLPFYRWISNYCLILVFINWAISGSFVKNFHDNKRNYLLYLPALFYAVILLSTLSSDNKGEAFFDAQVKLAFILFPILFLTMSSEFVAKIRNNVLLFFVGGNITALCCCYINATYNSSSFVNGSFLFQPNFYNPDFTFVESLQNGWNYFMYEKLSMFGHPAYFSMFLILSICFLYFVELKKAISKSKKILIVCVLIFLSVSNYLVFSRAGVILLFLVFLAMIVIRVFESKRKAIYVVILLGAGLMFSFFVATNARINDALKQVHGISEVSLSDSYSKSGRLVIWLNAWEVIDNHYLLGVGNGDVVDKMVVEYRKHSLDELAEKRINPHNQYLEIFLGSGIVGFVLLLMLLIVPIMRSFKEMDYLFLSFIGIVSFNLLFESVFNSQTGVFYFVFFYGLFAINCNRCVVEKTPHLL